jgi:hypothetical protein
MKASSFSCNGIAPKPICRLFGLALLMMFAGTASAAIGVDVNTSTDRSTKSTTIASTAFSTASANELLLAFVSADYISGTNTAVTKLTSGSLTWVLVVRTNTQSGTAEIWRAFSLTTLSTVTVTATLSQSVAASMTVMSFTGVKTSGTNGSGAIGVTASANASSGAPTAKLVTTQNNSWVFGVGNDWDNALARTLGSGQTMVHQYLSTVGDTYWVQRQTNTTPTSGTNVTINDTAPTTDRYNLSIVEVLPAASAGPSIAATGGTPQSAMINTAFATPLQTTLKDASNNPIVGATVTFTAPSSGASGTFASGGNTATTNSSGIANAPAFTANLVTGGYTVTASAAGVTTPASFSLTNIPGLAATIAATAGTPQSATIKTAFTTMLQATVKDAGNNPVSGVQVIFMAPGSGAGGTFSNGTATITVTTTGTGVAAAGFTANAAAGGPYNVTAMAGAIGPANFLLTNIAGPAANIAATAGTPQTVAINTAFGTPLQATVTDAASNPLVGVPVTLLAPGSGASGTFSNGTATITVTTNVSGVAMATFTANTTAGSYTVTAKEGTIGPANFLLTNNAGPAVNFATSAGTPQSATINTAFATALQAKVTDASNNPLSGVQVTFTAPSSGPSGTFSNGTATITLPTASNGVAAASFTANGVTGGAYIVTASASGLTGSVSFILTNNGLPPATITPTAGTPQSATINTTFGNALQAMVKDAGNNPVSGVNVTFAAPGTGASGTFAGSPIVTTNSSGIAMAPPFTANAVAGSYTVTASVSGVTTPASLSLTNNPGPAANVTATAGTPQNATINTVFATALQATVTDASNNPLTGVTVTFAAPGSGASGTFAGGVNTATTNTSGIATAQIFTANAVAGSYTLTASASGATSASFSLTNNAITVAALAIDVTTFGDSSTAKATVATPVFSTTSGNELLLAFLSTDEVSLPNTTVSSIAGAGLTWIFVSRTNVQDGDAEIWRAFAASPLANVTVTATLSQSVEASITMVSFTGVDPSGTNGSGAIGATGSGNAKTGAPSASLVTTRNNSWVFGVGNDFDNAISRTLGPSQTLIHQDLASVGDTYWVQRLTNPTTTSGTPVTVNDTAPTGDRYNLSIVEVLPATSGSSGPAASVAATAGTPQSATIETAFATSLQATVKDASSNPVSGVSVTFLAPGSGASGTFSNGAATITATTNGSGVATATFTANNTAGGYTVTAKAGAIGPANFLLTNVSGPAANIAAAAGTSQNTLIGTAFGTPLQATVTDTAGNLLNGVSVTFLAPGNGASGTFSNGAATITATTNGSGVATATFTANNTAGGYTVTAKAGAIGPANFLLTNNTGPAVNVAATVGTPQSATVNTAFGTAFQATVIDAGNNPVGGVTVTFTPPSAGAGGSFVGGVNTITTNSNGIATAPTFTANGVAGSYSVTASVFGLVTAATFTLTNNPVILGDSNLESLPDSMSAGQAQAVQAIATSAGSVNSLTVYLDPSSQASQIYVGIYSDDGSGMNPGALLGQGTLGQGGKFTLPAGWNSVAISTGNVALVANTPYWIAMLGTQGGNPVYRAASTTPCLTEASPLTNLTALPTAWTVGALGGSACPVSIFASLSPEISGTISGIPSNGGPTVVAGTGASSGATIADASGNYWLSVVANQTYTVIPSDAGYIFNPSSQTVNVNSSSVTGINFNALYSISGNAAGIAGVTVYLSGPTSASTISDGLGNYIFGGLDNGGPYTVTPSDIAYIFNPLSQQSITINGANVTGINFTANAAPPAYSISGKITLSSLGAGGGATVTLTAASTGAILASTTADSSGNFNLTGIPNGSYVVTPSSPTAVFTPANLNVTINGASYTTANFTAAGLVFYDDFTGTSLSSAWTVISRHGEYAQSETECNIPQMVSVANSNLTITTEAQSATCGDFNIDGSVRHAPTSWPYITGDIQWTNLNFTYGTIEIRAKYPSSATNLWPTAWLLGSNCQLTNIYTADTGYSSCPNLGSTGYTEIDMTECYNSGGWCQFHVANPSFGIGNGCDAPGQTVTPYSVDTNYHIFTTVWTSTSIQQYMDGSLITTCNQKLGNPMFLLIQTQTGGVGGTPGNSNLPAEFSIDYVKVTQP